MFKSGVPNAVGRRLAGMAVVGLIMSNEFKWRIGYVPGFWCRTASAGFVSSDLDGFSSAFEEDGVEDGIGSLVEGGGG